MAWLLDTNIISELYKGERGARSVRRWLAGLPAREIFLSVLVLGEIQRGVELRRLKDRAAAAALESWLFGLEESYRDRILPVTLEICHLWGRLSVRERLPDVDGLLAATALHHRLVLATGNKKDIARSGVEYFNPFVD